MEHSTEHDPLSEAPLLRSIPKADPFVVPDGFFDHFPHQVQAAVAKSNTGYRSWFPWRSPASWPARLVGVLGSAALALTIAGLWYFSSSPPSPEAVATYDLQLEQNGLDEIDWDDESILALIESEPSALPAAGHGFTDDELEAFLLNTELPLDQLTAEL